MAACRTRACVRAHAEQCTAQLQFWTFFSFNFPLMRLRPHRVCVQTGKIRVQISCCVSLKREIRRSESAAADAAPARVAQSDDLIYPQQPPEIPLAASPHPQADLNCPTPSPPHAKEPPAGSAGGSVQLGEGKVARWWVG